MATKRADGRYKASVYLGTVDGKKQYKYVYASTQKELTQKKADIVAMMNRGINVMLISDTLQTWVDKVAEIRKISTTDKRFREFKCHTDYFCKTLGNTPLRDINQSHLQAVINKLADYNPRTHKKTAKKTLQEYVVSLSIVFEYAIECRVTTFNPCRYVRIPENAPKKKRRALTVPERQLVVDNPYLPAMLLMFSGLRVGEATALLWSDVDLVNKTITVTKSYNFDEHCVKEPKTISGTRVVTIPDILVDYLRSVPRASIYVLTNKYNQPYSNHDWQRGFERYLKRLNEAYKEKYCINVNDEADIMYIYQFTPHELRHTFAHILHESRVPAAEAKRLLGHADIQTTLGVYTELDRMMVSDAGDQISSSINSKIELVGT